MSRLGKVAQRFSMRNDLQGAPAPAYDAGYFYRASIASGFSVSPPNYHESTNSSSLGRSSLHLGQGKQIADPPLLADFQATSPPRSEKRRSHAYHVSQSAIHELVSGNGGDGTLKIKIRSRAKSAREVPSFIGGENVEGTVQLVSKDGNDVRSVTVVVRLLHQYRFF
jgi:hypothetical protein